MDKLVLKLKRLKGKLKCWNWDVFGHVTRTLDILRDVIVQAESDDYADEGKIQKLKQEYETALLNEEIFYKQ